MTTAVTRGCPEGSPWRQTTARPREKDEQPRISLAKAPCVACGLPHWHPTGSARCVGCELRAAGCRRG